MRTIAETARHIAMVRYRMAQVADLQRERQELNRLNAGAEKQLDLAIQFAKLDSALRVARLALADILRSLPASERARFIKVHGPAKPSEQPCHAVERAFSRPETTLRAIDTASHASE
jgi:hypothetical protein